MRFPGGQRRDRARQIAESSDASSLSAYGDRQRGNEQFLSTLHNKTQLQIANKRIEKWTVHGEFLYFRDLYENKIVVYSMAQQRIERELQHDASLRSFALVGANFLVSVGADFVRVWSISDGKSLASQSYEFKIGYTSCTVVSPNSFLYIQKNIIRQLNIATVHSTAANLEQVNATSFNDHWIWSSEIRGGKIALVSETNRKLVIFDISTFHFTAQVDISPHLIEGFQLHGRRRYDVSFPYNVVLSVGDSKHSKLKILTFDCVDLKLLKSFIVPNPIHSTLDQHSKLTGDGLISMDANESSIRMQYYCQYHYQMLDISMKQERITSSYAFYVFKGIEPNCNSLRGGVVAANEDGHWLFGESAIGFQNETSLSIPNRGPIEKLYQECIQSGKRASHICVQLSPTMFDGSLFEFYCAHRLLMMDIQDGVIGKCLHHNGVDFKWHESIYSASKDIKLEQPDDTK